MFKIAENLKRIMDEKNLTNRSVEKKAELGAHAVTHIMNGKSANPKISTLVAIAKVLDCSIDYLVNGAKPSDSKFKESDSKIKEITWNLTLTIKCAKIIYNISEKRNIKLNTYQAQTVIQDLYNYMVRKAINEQGNEINLDIYEPDYTYADWIIEKVYYSV